MKYLFTHFGLLLAISVVNPSGALATETERTATERVQKTSEVEMIVKAKKAVLARLKDPDSAQFKDVRYGDSEATGPVAYGFVNSKNSFGGYTGFQRFISNGRTVLLDEEDNRLGEAWSYLVGK